MSAINLLSSFIKSLGVFLSYALCLDNGMPKIKLQVTYKVKRLL